MTIRLNDIRIFARHGVMPDERTIGAWFRVSLSIEAQCTGAAESDNLDDTINYAELAAIVKEEMATPSELIEHVAGRIGRRIIHQFPSIEQATITVEKENPPIGLECRSASVTLQFER